MKAAPSKAVISKGAVVTVIVVGALLASFFLFRKAVRGAIAWLNSLGAKLNFNAGPDALNQKIDQLRADGTLPLEQTPMSRVVIGRTLKAERYGTTQICTGPSGSVCVEFSFNAGFVFGQVIDLDYNTILKVNLLQFKNVDNNVGWSMMFPHIMKLYP